MTERSIEVLKLPRLPAPVGKIEIVQRVKEAKLTRGIDEPMNDHGLDVPRDIKGDLAGTQGVTNGLGEPELVPQKLHHIRNAEMEYLLGLEVLERTGGAML
uniref:hypothetical protein n=1 Tax=Alicyclobacillus acidocaldarius TaxID=405212 RepID=UPI0005A0E99B|nr:hypothetical protein [Alicyclobacillus acidocaldarius]